MNALPKPISVTRDTVVIKRADWKSLVDMLDDFSDRLAIRESMRRQEEGIDDGISIDFYWRIRKGENPIRVWREYRKMSLRKLATVAAVSPAYLSEVESGRKPGRAAALQRIARALGVDMDDVMPTQPLRQRKRRKSNR